MMDKGCICHESWNGGSELHILVFKFEGTDYRLEFEDDGKVAYAYLYEGSKIIGDVWLYNVCSAPTQPEWNDRSKIPFANPKSFAHSQNIKPISLPDEITVSWEEDEKGNLLEASIYIRGELFAGISPGSKPGWSKLTSKNGPLSKVMPNSKK